MNNDIIKEKKLFIFDMDGTIYLGDMPFGFAIEYIKRLRAEGRRVLFFTNNASKNLSAYMEKLTRLGFEPSEGEILTSGDVTIQFLLRHRPGKSVYLLGTPSLADSFTSKGIKLCRDADIVVSSFDLTLTYDKLEHACTLIRNGAEFLSTHPDLNCPTEHGSVPDSGAIAAAITASTGVSPTYFGKPYKQTSEMIAEFTGIPASESVIFGDRLYTDIALGVNSGMTSVLVFTGETTKEDYSACPTESRPTFALESLKELL